MTVTPTRGILKEHPKETVNQPAENDHRKEDQEALHISEYFQNFGLPLDDCADLRRIVNYFFHGITPYTEFEKYDNLNQ